MKILLTLGAIAVVVMALYSNRPVTLVEEQATEAPTQHAEAPVVSAENETNEVSVVASGFAFSLE